MRCYEIVFNGQLIPGAQLVQVQANLSSLFQADAARIALLFSGRQSVLKSNLDAVAAEKYRATLARAGALVEVRALAAEPLEAATDTGLKTARLTVVPRDAYMAAFAAVDAPDLGIAALGADLQDARPAAPPRALDLSQLSLAPVGSDMGERRPATVAAVPNIAHLSLLNP